MTLEEAIKHSEEVMVENLEKTKGRNASDPIAINRFECAEEHRQLVEWLKDYKQLLDRKPCEDCISRQTVIDKMKERDEKLECLTVKDVRELPSVKPQEIKWDRLYNWLNDMRLGIAPDETVTDIDERNERIAQTDIIDEIMEWMLKQEPQERSDDK